MVWKLFRSVAKTLLGLLLLGGAAASIPFFIPSESYHASVEHLLSDGLGRDVQVRELHYRLFPLPHIVGSGISITSRDMPGEAVIKQVDLWLDPNALLRGNVIIKRAHFSGIAANQGFIEGFAKSAKLWGVDSGAAPITVARVTASTIMVRDRVNRVHGPFSFDGHFGGRSGFERIRLAMDDDSFAVDLKPLTGALEIHAHGRNVRVPGAPHMSVTHVNASAILTNDALYITQLSLQAFGGWAEGDIRLRWSDAGSVVEGRVSVQNIALRELQRWTGTINLAGRASGLLEFTATGRSLAELPRAAAVVADLSVQDGAVAIGNPLFETQRFNAQVTLTTQVTGKPNLPDLLGNAKLSGNITAGDGRFLYDGAVLAFADLNARGAVDRHAAMVETAEVAAYGGTFQISGAQVSWRGSPAIHGQLRTQNVAVEALLKLLAADNAVAGAITSDLTVTLSAPEWERILANPQIEGSISLHRVVVRNPGLEALPVKPGSPWLTLREVTMTGRYENRSLSLVEGEIAAYDGKIRATGLTLSWQEDWHLRTQVEAQELPIAPVLARFTDDAALDGLLSAQGHLSLSAPDIEAFLDAMRFDGSASVTNGRVPRIPNASSGEGNSESWLTFERANVKATYENHRLNIAMLELHTHGGQITSENAVVDWSSGWSVAGPVTVSTVQLGPLLQPFLTENVVTGELNAQLQTKLQAVTADVLLDSIGMTGDFYISNGTVFKGDLGKAGTAVLTTADGKGSTHFQVLSGSVTVKSGTVRVRNLHLESDSLSADGELRVSEEQRLTGTLTVASKGTGPFTIPLNIGGTVDDPRYSLSRGAMVGSAMGTTLLGPGLGTLIGMQAGRLFSVLGSLFSHNKEKIEQEREQEEL